ncbi:MAG: glycosyl transferase, partial [Hellea sp.]
MKKICHLSSAHQGLDVRIFHKECVSLASFGYDTHLVIMANQMDIEFADTKNVKIHPLPSRSGRVTRMLFQTWTCYKIAKDL